MGPIVLLTDFGQKDGYVGVMKGVIHGIAPGASVIDLTHEIRQGDLRAAGFVLWNQHRFFPKDSLFVCVVDPGVGSDRAIMAVKTERHLFLVPDNGLMDLILAETKAHTILRLENPAFFRDQNISSTFHGRDIFAAAAGHLAAGEIYTQLGPFHQYSIPPSPFLEPEEGVSGTIFHIDHFGNLISTLKQSEKKRPIAFNLEDHLILVKESYSEVEPGQALAIAASHGLWEIAIRNGSAREEFSAERDMKITPVFSE